LNQALGVVVDMPRPRSHDIAVLGQQLERTVADDDVIIHDVAEVVTVMKAAVPLRTSPGQVSGPFTGVDGAAAEVIAKDEVPAGAGRIQQGSGLQLL
jgi:hypothetical protein